MPRFRKSRTRGGGLAFFATSIVFVFIILQDATGLSQEKSSQTPLVPCKEPGTLSKHNRKGRSWLRRDAAVPPERRQNAASPLTKAAAPPAAFSPDASCSPQLWLGKGGRPQRGRRFPTFIILYLSNLPSVLAGFPPRRRDPKPAKGRSLCVQGLDGRPARAPAPEPLSGGQFSPAAPLSARSTPANARAEKGTHARFCFARGIRS